MGVVFQVALIVFLSHIGSFVPADAATVGLTDRCLTFMIPASFLE
jgi:DNA mismatch repair protein MSH5